MMLAQKNIKFRPRCLVVIVGLSFLCLVKMMTLAVAEPLQYYFDYIEEGIINEPFQVSVFALDEFGGIDKSFSGERTLRLIVSDVDDNALVKLKGPLVRFNAGEGQFSLIATTVRAFDLAIEIDGFVRNETLHVVFKDGLNVTELDHHPKNADAPVVTEIIVESSKILMLQFDEEVDESNASQEGHYLAVTNKKEIKPQKVEFHPTYVYLTFDDDFDEDEEGYIEIEDLSDLAGNSDTIRSPSFQGTCPCSE
ncbi:hypothetical protein ACFL49_02685 [Candidatus Omnitrophota bacterium]